MKKSLGVLGGVIFFVLLAVALAEKRESQGFQPGKIIGETTGPITVQRDFGRMPLHFIPNRGQIKGLEGYYIQGKDKTIYFNPDGLTFVLAGGTAVPNYEEDLPPIEAELSKKADKASGWVAKLDFIGANPDVRPQGIEETGAVISYFKGRPEDWHTGLPSYSKISYHSLWPGIDLVYYGSVDKLKYEFLVHPGADPAQIRLAYRGALCVSLDEQGSLDVLTPLGGFRDDTPVAYQEIDEQKKGVSIAYELSAEPRPATGPAGGIGTGGQEFVYGFAIGDYDTSRLLVLDPAMLVYCGFIGGSSSEYGKSIAVDGSGNAYVTGDSSSSQATFPVLSGPDLTFNGG
jgi:hypothetical protein